jgi:hypothetical protein
MGLVTGFRIFDALFVESLTVPEDTSPVLSAMADAANERIELLFEQSDGGQRFRPTPLAFSCEPLVSSISLADFVLREVGFDIAQMDEMPEQVTNNDDVAFTITAMG